MVKRGGTKRKIKMEKIGEKASRSVSFSKRRNGLYSKVSQLCLLTGAQIAVLATPASSSSNFYFYSFGHSSVNAVVTAFLKGQRPVREEPTREDDDDIGVCMTRKDLGLGLWFEDERLVRSKNLQELTGTIDSISRMLTNLHKFRSDVVLQDQQTLTLHSDYSQTCCIPPAHTLLDDDNLPANITEEDQTLINLQSNPPICIPEDHDASSAGFNKTSEEQDQSMAICESFRATEEYALDPEFDTNLLIDFATNFDTSTSNDWSFESTTLEENTLKPF